MIFIKTILLLTCYSSMKYITIMIKFPLNVLNLTIQTNPTLFSTLIINNNNSSISIIIIISNSNINKTSININSTASIIISTRNRIPNRWCTRRILNKISLTNRLHLILVWSTTLSSKKRISTDRSHSDLHILHRLGRFNIVTNRFILYSPCRKRFVSWMRLRVSLWKQKEFHLQHRLVV